MSSIHVMLVATDFSAHAKEATELAKALAKALGARIHLVHAFDLPLPFVSPAEIAVPDGYLEDCRAAAAAKLEEALEDIRFAGIEADSAMREVPAAHALAEEAEAIDADLIVMGTRGNTGLKHALLGSVAERTVRIAPCPVLTVPTGAA